MKFLAVGLNAVPLLNMNNHMNLNHFLGGLFHFHDTLDIKQSL